MIHDTDPEGAEFALDALLYIGGKGEYTAASFPLVLGDIGCDVTCQVIALSSKPLPPIQIARVPGDEAKYTLNTNDLNMVTTLL